jgi:hypothetical protein
MLIRNYKLIVPLLAFLFWGPAASAQMASQFGEEAIVADPTSMDLEEGSDSKIQDKLQKMEIQTKFLSSLPVSLEIKKDAIEEGFLETAHSAMLSPETLFLAKLEQLQADIKSSPIGVLQIEPLPMVAIASTKSMSGLSTHMAQTIEKLRVSNARAKSISDSLDLNEKNKDAIATTGIPVEGEVSLRSSDENSISESSEKAVDEVPPSEGEQAINQTELVSQSSSTPDAPTTTPVESLDSLKQELKIDPIFTNAKRTYPPSLSFGIPSAFGPGWGDFFISASGSTAGNRQPATVDGSISTGFGIGDINKFVGLGFTYNLGSISNFGSNGTFDMQGSRVVYADAKTQVAVSAGWNAFGQYGNEGVTPSSVYGTVTSFTQLQPDDPINKLPLMLSVGVGGGVYRQDPASTGVFGGFGLQVAPQLGVGLQWSGVGLNLGLSFVPIPTIPLTIVATGVDLTDNSPGGTVFLLSLSYGFNFLPSSQ